MNQDNSVSSASLWPFRVVRKLYDWVLGLAERPHGAWFLFWIALAESSFFPIPPDVLLIALTVGAPKRAYWFAAICSLGSIIGAAIGYLLGFQFFELLGRPIVDFYSAGDAYSQVQSLYNDWNALAVGVAGFTPIPFKVFTIAAGAFQVDFLVFLFASAVSRSARFFLVGGLIRWFGPEIKTFVDRYFNWLTVAFTVLLITGFLVLKYVF